MTTVLASTIKPGDLIQHPKQFWPAKYVLRVEKRPISGQLRFVLPAALGGETGVTMQANAPVLLH